MTPGTYQLIIEYDGRLFDGWQKQPKKRTVQGELEKALADLYGMRVSVVGSGRTDKGVHALGQSAHIRVPKRFKPTTIQRALNARLPNDVVIIHCLERSDAFHARFSATAKTYEYRLSTRAVRPALMFHYQGHEPNALLDEKAMRRAAKVLEGRHCFKTFSAKDPSRREEKEDFVRCIERIEIEQVQEDLWRFRIKANGFLYKMARLLVRAIVNAGRGRLAVDTIAELLREPRRGVIAPPMPPQGLYLVSVEYGE